MLWIRMNSLRRRAQAESWRRRARAKGLRATATLRSGLG